MSEWVSEFPRAHACAYVRACVCACECVRASACVCILASARTENAARTYADRSLFGEKAWPGTITTCSGHSSMGYSRDTRRVLEYGVLKGYSKGTRGVLEGYSRANRGTCRSTHRVPRAASGTCSRGFRPPHDHQRHGQPGREYERSRLTVQIVALKVRGIALRVRRIALKGTNDRDKGTNRRTKSTWNRTKGTKNRNKGTKNRKAR